ncbi:MAG: hypothetical protein ACRD98_12095, partial [Nitrososphaera sp.]
DALTALTTAEKARPDRLCERGFLSPEPIPAWARPSSRLLLSTDFLDKPFDTPTRFVCAHLAG